MATRDLEIGHDTQAYARFYQSLDTRFIEARFEPGFLGLSKALSALGFNLEAYFGVLFAILLASHLFVTLHTARALNLDISHTLLAAISLGILFAWPFFPSAAVNGIRQGLSAPFTFLSLILSIQRRWFPFLLASALAVSFHFTALLFLPFVPLALSPQLPLLAVMLGSFLYATGVSESLIHTLSPKLHKAVSEYGADAIYQAGLRIDFLLFSLFLYLFFRLFALFLGSPMRRDIRAITNCYLICLLPFLLLGWGAFSNRYLLPAWLTSAIILAILVSATRIRQLPPLLLAMIAPLIGLGVFALTTFL